ncbi:hypothetical protein BGX30_004296 [Mortierella sp. GBA39]|nr:hypothetical protein BGX30_004296 [Mortierella sp. GBA39]
MTCCTQISVNREVIAMSPKGLTVREMLKLPVMEHAQLISGERGLDRIVQYIDIWEVPDIGNWLREGEMVLTTGYSTRNDPSLLVEMIEQLAKAVLLRRAEEVNKALTRLVLNNKGIQVVADNVSELIDSPIWIIGKAGEVLASSPEGYPYRSSGKHHQWEVSVDNKMLGKFVVEKRELNELDLMLIEQARLVFSLELMRNKIAKDTENRLRGTFFEELILNTVSDERVTASRGRQLGLSPEWLWEVAVVEADEPFYNEDSSVVTNIQAFIRKESAARKVRSQLQIHGGRIVLFLPSAKPAGQDRRIVDKDVTLPWCDALSGQLSAWEGVRMGIGRPGSLVEAHRSYGEARTAVSIGYRLNQERRMFTYTEVEMIHLLQESTDPARLNRFVEEKVGVLAEHDRTHGTNYVRTLYHYMATGGSLNETSLRMFIHRNSVNYRMDRIKSILGLDLNNPRNEGVIDLIGLIRVFTAKDNEVLQAHGNMIQEQFEVPVMSRSIPDQPLGIYDDASEEAALPKIVELGIQMEQEGCRLLIVSCAADPGVRELRSRVSIPVIGAGSSAALVALSLGEPVGLMGITEGIPPVMKVLLDELIVGYSRPEGVTNTTDLMTEAGRQKALEGARSLVEKGAKAIVFACTGFSTIHFADVIRKELQVPVVDIVEAEGLMAANYYKQIISAS